MRKRGYFYILLFSMVTLCPLTSDIISSLNLPENPPVLTVQLVVVGPGPEIYTWWGHTGIIIKDNRSEMSRFYDFGNFSFETENFYRNFMKGRLIYQGIYMPANLYLNYVSTLGRQMDIYTLNLSSAKARELSQLLREQTSPENSEYLYDHFEDNCATRIRDYLDIAFDGKLEEYSSEIPAGTFREQFRRFSYFQFPIDITLNYLQGSFVDQPISMWEAQFLPWELGHMLEGLNEIYPVILEHQELARAIPVYDRINEYAPPLWIKSLIWGLACAFILFLMICLSYRKMKTFWLTTAWALMLLGTGVSGTILLLMTQFTDHHVTFHNLNLLYSNPASLLLLCLLKNRRKRIQDIFKLIWLLLTTMLIFVILRDLVSSSGHQNGGVALFFLPGYLLFAWQLLLGCGTPAQLPGGSISSSRKDRYRRRRYRRWHYRNRRRTGPGK